MNSNDWLREYAKRVLAFDLRSLAIFRIALGLLVIVDVLHRFPILTEMHTGDGFFTRSMSFQYYDERYGATWSQMFWSVYWLSDSPIFVFALQAITFICAVMLIVGKWTRSMTVILWVLIASLHVRNPLITSSGDYLFKMMLFWSIFLPLGAIWSLDRKSNTSAEEQPERYTAIASMATLGYLCQLIAVYFFPGLAKWNPDWLTGGGLEVVLRLNIYIRDFGTYLLQFPTLLKWTSWFTLFAELVLVWTLFIFRGNARWRCINIATFCSFHIGIAVCMSIGLFPWICVVAWIPLLPGFLFQRDRKTPHVDNEFQWTELTTPKLAAQLICGLALGLIALWNVGNIEHPVGHSVPRADLQYFVNLSAIDQHFKMFGQTPKQNPWFVYEARLADGKIWDIRRDAPIQPEPPESGLEVFPNFHWRKFHRNSILAANQFVRQRMLEHAVKKWDTAHPDRTVTSARLIVYTQSIGEDYHKKSIISNILGSYTTEEDRPGALFESFLKEDNELPF